MAIEIERKFLVVGDGWRDTENSQEIWQGYLVSDEVRSVRVRIRGEEAWLTIKGASSESGISRSEFEYEIPLSEAQELLDSVCLSGQIHKRRYLHEVGEHTWEVDEFFGENEGLMVAEIELSSEEQTFEKPDWLGEEVSDDPRYFNARLIEHPFTRW